MSSSLGRTVQVVLKVACVSSCQTELQSGLDCKERLKTIQFYLPAIFHQIRLLNSGCPIEFLTERRETEYLADRRKILKQYIIQQSWRYFVGLLRSVSVLDIFHTTLWVFIRAARDVVVGVNAQLAAVICINNLGTHHQVIKDVLIPLLRFKCEGTSILPLKEKKRFFRSNGGTVRCCSHTVFTPSLIPITLGCSQADHGLCWHLASKRTWLWEQSTSYASILSHAPADMFWMQNLGLE